MNLADNLKKIRKENNLSQEQLAEKLGVSRQSVSKWESNQAYPEMDKVIQLTKLFNLNIDDLLNQDISEVNNEKQSKITINKYIDDFLSFITKTIDMFSSMKFKNKCKCIIEQFIIVLLLIITFLIIGSIGSYVLSELIQILPYSITSIIKSIFKSIYIILGLITGITLLIHIFKVRYLDYYIIIKENEIEQVDKNNSKENITDQDKKIYLEKKKEKIIIRDPNHSEYKFISGMLKCLLIFIKGIVLIISLIFCISIIILTLSLIVSFLIIKTGLFFLGILLSIISFITINIIVLIILFNFITNKKSKNKPLLITLITSLLLCGIGIGTILVELTSFDYIDDINNSIYIEDELIIPMQDNLIIQNITYYDNEGIEYIEEEIEDIKIVYKHTKYYELSQRTYSDNNIFLEMTNISNNPFDILRQTIKDINNKEIVNYTKFKIYIYTSKENIQKLKRN